MDGQDDPIPLAGLTTADLDATTLAALFADIAALTEVLEVQVKGAERSHAGATDLEGARRQLEAGARGMQMRYRWDGGLWCDTLVRTPAGIRLVRTRISTGGSADAGRGPSPG